MAVYREGYLIVEEIEKASVRIFQDSCDFGAPTKKGDKIWNLATQLVSMHPIKGTRNENRYKTGRSVSHDIELIDEWAYSDDSKTLKEATDIYRIEFTSCDYGKCEGYDGFINIFKLN